MLPQHGSVDLASLLRQIGGTTTTEATLQSQIHTLLVASGLNIADEQAQQITLESPAGERRRIDIEVGHVCIEVKKQLRGGRQLEDAVEQLGTYLSDRADELGQRYVGVLTDGRTWQLHHLADEQMRLVSTYQVMAASPDVNAFLSWLAGVLATEERIAPTARAIGDRLGAASAGHLLEQADLRSLYEAHRDDPEVAVKRELWAKLLTTALGTQFDSDDHDLFVEHTLLVATAEIVAHAVLGFDIRELDGGTLLRGELFSRRALILGVVEQDFFDWPLDCGSHGQRWVLALARRLAQFDWALTQHDAMKTIYESVITAETRKQLGEYYTPDFLAEHMVDTAVSEPLSQRVLDPSCGSGTFLFHAVRRYLRAADAAGHSNADALTGVVGHVAGIDVHPVAVTLARVTYLLAIGPDRLQDVDRLPLRIPVYLGDSLQWGQRQDLFGSETLNVDTDDGLQMFADQLQFPQALLDDADRFDQLVAEMADAAAGRDRGSAVPAIGPIARRHGLAGAELDTIDKTFRTMCRLHDEGRDHIWGYFVRNLARPAWFARQPNRVDVLVGNPPWLAFRFMTSSMQERFRDMAKRRRLWSGGSVATQQDLSDLFVVRAIEQYLTMNGAFSFVMPAGVFARGQYEGFRSGNWQATKGTASAAAIFDQGWDLSEVRPYFFPRTSAVIHGRRARPTDSLALSTTVEVWNGLIPDVSGDWETVAPRIDRVVRDRGTEDQAASPYRERFSNGATIFPRVLTTVVTDDASPIGAGQGRIPVRSDRGTYEKKPWKELDALQGVVEQRFLYPLILGESVLPFRQLPTPMAVLPINPDGRLIDPGEEPGLADWWARASQLWDLHRTSSLTLTENVNYRRKLTNQFPLVPHRVVVAHSAMHVAACRVSDPLAVVEHQLDWAAVRSEEEGQYLCAILNSPVVTVAVTPYMTSGKGGGRHIGKSLWKVPVPAYDAADQKHQRLAELGGRAEALIGAVELPRGPHGTQRRTLRGALAASQLGEEVDDLVAELLQHDRPG